MSREKEGIVNIEQPEIGDGGIIVLPAELKDAPDDVKDSYMVWAAAKEKNKNNPRRHFSFINELTGDLEEVDCMMFRGAAEKYALARNISKSDLELLRVLTLEMEQRKKAQMRLKQGWVKWVRKRAGRDVYEWRKADMVEWYARFFSHDEVKEKLEKMGYYVDINSLYKFFLRNKDTIDKARVEFIRSSHDHYIASEAGRMETLSMLHYKFIKKFDEEFSKHRSDNKELRLLSQEIRAVLDQARKELKGEEVKLTIDGKIDINASIIASRTIQEVSRKIPINLIVIYLIAAKRGIQPHNILTSLTTSFYKDFNGFGKVSAGQPKNTIDLIRSYDWNEIVEYQKNKQVEDNEIPLSMYEEVPFTEQAKVITKREKLKNLLQQNREGIKE